MCPPATCPLASRPTHHDRRGDSGLRAPAAGVDTPRRLSMGGVREVSPRSHVDGSASMNTRAGGLLLIAGAGVYALLLGPFDVTFNATPLIIGAVAVVAGTLGRTPRLVLIGVTLTVWGLAVVLVREGPIPDDREAAAFLVGIGVGLMGAHVLARRLQVSMTGSLVAAIVASLAFYLSFDLDWLNDWQTWAVALAAWGVVELARSTTASGRSDTRSG